MMEPDTKGVADVSVSDAAFLELLKRKILEVEPDATVILFGSRARGDAGPESDWDVLVLSDGKVGYERKSALRKKIPPLELEHEKLISVIVRNRREWQRVRSPFRVEVANQGVVL